MGKKDLKKKEDQLPVQKVTIDDIPELLEKVSKQIEELEGATKGPAKVINLTGFGDIKTITSIESLIKAASMVIGKEKAYYEAAREVMPARTDGKTHNVPAFTINGHKKDEVLKAITKRISAVINAEELKKLKEVKKTLEANLSAEAKLMRDLAKISEILKED